MYTLVIIFILMGNTTIYEMDVDKCPDPVEILQFEARNETPEGIVYLTCHAVKGTSI